MHLHILAVGNKMPTWVNNGFTEYSKRFTQPYSLNLIEIPAAKRFSQSSSTSQSPTDILKYQQTESASIKKILKADKFWIALEVNGKTLTTEDLSKKLVYYSQKTSDLYFVIGGPDGLDKTFSQAATEQWSLSALTLPHPLVRILLVEQLYRATTILKNHPYHRG